MSGVLSAVAQTAAGVFSGAGDPLTGVVTRVLTPPLREVYAVLLRAGVIEIVD
ncbi:Rv1535 domain-containing protein [Rhodococcus sp. NCIMB 12038]|uniref:Rv1535 domain-containing protein n=1 Tax=Rhodococcus TaxID=1827 RepID=UPI00358ED718